MPSPCLKMRSAKARGFLLAVALFVPAPALAKGGSDAAQAAAGAFVLFAVFAFLIEAEVFRRKLGTGVLRALGWSALCHLASLPVVALVGMPLLVMPGLEANYVAVAAVLAFFYAVSWLVHWPVVAGLSRRSAQARKMSARGATLLANAICLAITGAIVVAALPRPGATPGALVREALEEMAALEREVTANARSGRGLPAPRPVSTAPEGPLQSLRIDAGGRIVGMLRIPRERELDGKTLVLEPRLEGGEIDRWICHTDADLIMTARFLPQRCRWSAKGIEQAERMGGRVGEAPSVPRPAGPDRR